MKSFVALISDLYFPICCFLLSFMFSFKILIGFQNHSLNSSHTITCTLCGKYGHTEVVCFRKVGFGNVKTSKFSSTRKFCTFCNRLGHTVDTCYKKHGFPPGCKFTNWTSQANNMIATNTFSEFFS